MILPTFLLIVNQQTKQVTRLSEDQLIGRAAAIHERMSRAMIAVTGSKTSPPLKPYRLLKSSGEERYMIDSASGDTVDIAPDGTVVSFFHFVELDPKKPFLPDVKLRSRALAFLSAFEPSLSGLDGEFDPGMFWNSKDGGWNRFFRPFYRQVPVGPGGIGQINLEGNTGLCIFATARRMFDLNGVRPSRITPDQAVATAMSKTLRTGKASMVSLHGEPKKWLTGNGSQLVYTLEATNPAVQRMAKLDTGEFTYEVFVKHEDTIGGPGGQGHPLSGYLISAVDGTVFGTLKGGPGGYHQLNRTHKLPVSLENVTFEKKGKKTWHTTIRFSPVADADPRKMKLEETVLLTRQNAFRIKLSKDGSRAEFGDQVYKVTY